MLAYKGFDENLKCRGFQYEVGKEYETDEAVVVCDKGFHACEDPLDVFTYYPPAKSRYCLVELSGSIDRDDSDSKIASSKIKIVAEIGLPGLIKAKFDYAHKHYTAEHTDPQKATAGDHGAATAGEYGAATAGDCGAATAGEYGAATAGEYGAATAGDCGTATAGYCGAATAGDHGAATAGEYGAATAGDHGAATAGYHGAATSKGIVSVGPNGCGLVRGNDIKIRGGLGAVLVLCVENDDDHNIAECKSFIVDGESVKADTWYTLKNGVLKECSE